jgi:hypothetical protein
MMSFVKSPNMKKARDFAPWANIFKKYGNGYMAFLDEYTFDFWKKNLKIFYKKRTENEI